MDVLKKIKKSKVRSLGILFLKGVYKRDCRKMEDVFQTRLLADDTTRDEDAKEYDKIPSKFTDLENWPKRTNLPCWGCKRHFKTRPWFEPQSIEPTSTGGVGTFRTAAEIKKLHQTADEKRGISVITDGNFCCGHCVRWWIDRNSKNIAECENKKKMLVFIYEVFTGKIVVEVKPSPNFTERQEWGGPLTDAEYQQKIDKLASDYIDEYETDNIDNIRDIYLKKLMNV